MRFPFIFFAGLLFSVASTPVALGQNDQKEVPPAPSDAASTKTGPPYLIEFVEFQIDASDGAVLSPEQLVESYPQMKSDGLLKRAETIRFYASEQKASFVNFGKQIALTTGATFAAPGRPVVRQTSRFEVGTTAEVMLDSVDAGQATLQVAYRSSRVEGAGTDDSPPAIVSNNMEATLVLELGKTNLLGGTSGDPNVYVLISVSESPRP